MLLSVQNLDVFYGQIQALHGVSLNIEKGQIVTLIGANGAGKSTLLRTISGLIRPRAGSVTWSGDPLPPKKSAEVQIQSRPAHEIVRMGISHVPEGRQIFAPLTVMENLRLGAFQRNDDIEPDLERVFSLFPVLAERRIQRAGTLSGGEQQMLAIGRALMQKPQLLLLDEPSLGLAPLVVRKIFQIIREINAQGMTIFLVEQNAHMALTVAHQAYVLQTGEVIKSGDAATLLADPEVKNAYLGG